jgi:N-acetylneuraminic acid mutarotase
VGNTPGARHSSVAWKGASGEFWLFGGNGRAASGFPGGLNDLWRFDGTYWTWISGNSSTDHGGTYGSKGVPDGGNAPGSREGAVGWTDANGDLWMFGGFGGAATTGGWLNDLWRFDGVYWTWMSGDSEAGQPGSYGTQGVPDSGNVPGARYESIAWYGVDGALWLFGGNGYAIGPLGDYNDLWRFDR